MKQRRTDDDGCFSVRKDNRNDGVLQSAICFRLVMFPCRSSSATESRAEGQLSLTEGAHKSLQVLARGISDRLHLGRAAVFMLSGRNASKRWLHSVATRRNPMAANGSNSNGRNGTKSHPRKPETTNNSGSTTDEAPVAKVQLPLFEMSSQFKCCFEACFSLFLILIEAAQKLEILCGKPGESEA